MRKSATRRRCCHGDGTRIQASAEQDPASRLEAALHRRREALAELRQAFLAAASVAPEQMRRLPVSARGDAQIASVDLDRATGQDPVDAMPSGPVVQRNEGGPRTEGLEVGSRRLQRHQGRHLGGQPDGFGKPAVEERREPQGIAAGAQGLAVPLDGREPRRRALKLGEWRRRFAMHESGHPGTRLHGRPLGRVGQTCDLEPVAVVVNGASSMPAHPFGDTLDRLRLCTQAGDEATSHRRIRRTREGSAPVAARRAPGPPGAHPLPGVAR
jgi:hypothetical protein